ncbi:MAG: hypothetical protein ACXVI6_01720, partial [Candidatus Aminicenantales bacterium]
MISHLQPARVVVRGALMILAVFAFGQQNPATREDQAPVTIQPITFGLMLVKGGSGANSGLIILNKEMFAVDAKMSPESVQAMLEEIKKTVSFPVTKVILTHSDGDHVNGLPGFPRGIAIIAQDQVKADMIKAAADLPALLDYLP